MELERLVAALAPEAVLGSPDPVEVRDLAYDARAVTPGAAFFAVPGERADGHDFAAEAVENGAVALVVERAVEPRGAAARRALDAGPRWRPPPTSSSASRRASSRLPASPGRAARRRPRTSCYSVLEAAGRRPGLLGTVESRVGGEVRPVVAHDAGGDRPPAHVPRDARRRQPQRRARGVVPRARVLHRLDRVRFDALVFTNLSQDHLDFHGSMEDYFAAKRRLFAGAAPPPAAVNIGDEWGRRLAEELAVTNRAPLITFGLPTTPRSGPTSSSSARRARDSGRRDRDRVALRGRFNVENVARRDRGARLLLDVDEDEIAAGIARARGRARADSRRSTRASRSPSSSTTRTSRTRSTTCSGRHASSPTGRVIVVFGARRRPRPRQAPADGQGRRATSPTS